MIEMRNDGESWSVLAYGHVYAEGLTMEQARAVWKELIGAQLRERKHGSRRVFGTRRS